MRIKVITISALLAFCSVPVAQAGSCPHSAHCYSVESGVNVFRGQHAPVVSQDAIRLEAERARQAQAARELAEVRRLTAAVQQQNNEIAALRNEVSQANQRNTRRQRRRVYYGNPAFFGRNGFIGNRFFSGATVPLPPRPRRPRRPRPGK